MKKKFLGLLLVLVMILSLNVVVFADPEPGSGGGPIDPVIGGRVADFDCDDEPAIDID